MVVFLEHVETALDVWLIYYQKKIIKKKLLLDLFWRYIKIKILGNNLVETEIGISKTNWE